MSHSNPTFEAFLIGPIRWPNLVSSNQLNLVPRFRVVHHLIWTLWHLSCGPTKLLSLFFFSSSIKKWTRKNIMWHILFDTYDIYSYMETIIDKERNEGFNFKTVPKFWESYLYTCCAETSIVWYWSTSHDPLAVTGLRFVRWSGCCNDTAACWLSRPLWIVSELSGSLSLLFASVVYL